MKKQQLGNSDIHITPIGIGAWAMGGGGWNGSMGPQNEADSVPQFTPPSITGSTGLIRLRYMDLAILRKS